MSLTAEVLFVNPDYLKRITNLNGSVEDAYVVPSVIVAQDKFIQQYLGTDLMVALKEYVTSGSFPANYENLLDNYVRKATAWWTMVDLIPSLYVKIDNGGLVIRSAENTTAISPDDLHREVERARMNAQFYTERLVAFLTNNSSLFAEYSSNSGDEISPIQNTYDQNGMTISGNGLTELRKYLFS